VCYNHWVIIGFVGYNIMANTKIPPGFHGKKGRSGRKKTLSTIMREVMENDAQNLPLYFKKTSELALKGDRESLHYLIDRHLGKAKASLDIAGGEELGAGVMIKLIQLYAQKRKEYLEGNIKEIKEGDNAVQRQGTSERILEGQKEATADVQP